MRFGRCGEAVRWGGVLQLGWSATSAVEARREAAEWKGTDPDWDA